jgi:hypothetical protein
MKRKGKFRKTSEMMEQSCYAISIIVANRPITGKDDGDILLIPSSRLVLVIFIITKRGFKVLKLLL